MPDFLHGDYATPELLADTPKLLEWVGRVGTVEVVSKVRLGGVLCILI